MTQLLSESSSHLQATVLTPSLPEEAGLQRTGASSCCSGPLFCLSGGPAAGHGECHMQPGSLMNCSNQGKFSQPSHTPETPLSSFHLPTWCIGPVGTGHVSPASELLSLRAGVFLYFDQLTFVFIKLQATYYTQVLHKESWAGSEPRTHCGFPQGPAIH